MSLMRKRPLAGETKLQPVQPRDADGPGNNGEGLLTPAAVAARLAVTERVLERWRSTGDGPRFIRLSRKTIRYRACDLEEFVSANVRRNTAA